MPYEAEDEDGTIVLVECPHDDADYCEVCGGCRECGNCYCDDAED
jgi:hypothetical protein